MLNIFTPFNWFVVTLFVWESYIIINNVKIKINYILSLHFYFIIYLCNPCTEYFKYLIFSVYWLVSSLNWSQNIIYYFVFYLIVGFLDVLSTFLYTCLFLIYQPFFCNFVTYIQLNRWFVKNIFYKRKILGFGVLYQIYIRVLVFMDFS